MKDIVSSLKGRWSTKRIILSMLIAITAVALISGVVFAATVFTVPISHSGSVVTAPPGGGGGGGGTPVPTYDFTVSENGSAISSIVWGNITIDHYIERTVTLTRTGNQNILVTPDLSAVPANVTLVATPSSANLTDTTPVNMVLRLTGISAGDFSFTTDFKTAP